MPDLPQPPRAPSGSDPDGPQTLAGPSLVGQAVNRGQLRVRGIGMGRHYSGDVYYRMMSMSWPWLGVGLVGVFMVFNLAFAGLYAADPAGLAINGNAVAAPIFWRDFFFSVHTVATIGYGNIYPVSLWANVVVVIEITLGIIFFALATGIAFARFSRPTARILFSRRMIVRDIDGIPTLMLRAANQRHNMIYAAQARLALLVDDNVGGVQMRRFVDLALTRQNNPVFALSWTIMHPIDSDSPLSQWLADPHAPRGDEIIVILSGSDEVSGQTIHGRWAYFATDISWDHRFADIIGFTPDGWRTIDYGRFHEVLPG